MSKIWADLSMQDTGVTRFFLLVNREPLWSDVEKAA
jgi:hypothetical protein